MNPNLNHYKVEYTDFSKLNRLRLEESYLPDALQIPCLVSFRGASLLYSHMRDDSHTPSHFYISHDAVETSNQILIPVLFGNLK